MYSKVYYNCSNCKNWKEKYGLSIFSIEHPCKNWEEVIFDDIPSKTCKQYCKNYKAKEIDL